MYKTEISLPKNNLANAYNIFNSSVVSTTKMVQRLNILCQFCSSVVLKRSDKIAETKFFSRSRAANSIVGGGIRSKF